jgi:hypothetical protein
MALECLPPELCRRISGGATKSSSKVTAAAESSFHGYFIDSESTLTQQ